MRTIFWPAFLLLLLAACDNAPAPDAATSAVRSLTTAPPPEQTFRGMYRSGASGAAFYICDSSQTYLVRDRPAGLDSLYRAACGPAPCPDESVYAVLRGRLELPARPGAPGILHLSAIDTLQPKTVYNTCLPFDFWCLGTEPFWGLFISEQDGGFCVKIMGAERGLRFPWAAPIKTASSWTYTSTHPQTGEKLRVVVRREPCSDGMSERAYDYSVEMTLGQEVYHGCGMRNN